MRSRAIYLIRAAVFGFLVVFLAGIAIAATMGMATELTHTSSLSLGLGPVPVASAYWSDSSSGYSTGWGVGALAYVAAAVNLVLAWRGKPYIG